MREYGAKHGFMGDSIFFYRKYTLLFLLTLDLNCTCCFIGLLDVTSRLFYKQCQGLLLGPTSCFCLFLFRFMMFVSCIQDQRFYTELSPWKFRFRSLFTAIVV